MNDIGDCAEIPRIFADHRFQPFIRHDNGDVDIAESVSLAASEAPRQPRRLDAPIAGQYARDRLDQALLLRRRCHAFTPRRASGAASLVRMTVP